MSRIDVLHPGPNTVDGVPVEVVRKSCRRINIHVGADGAVRLTVPKWWATLRQGEAFLAAKWPWVLKTRAKALAHPPVAHTPPTEAELAALKALLTDLNATWSARVGEPDVAWRIRRVKSLWGCCHWRDRYITYNADLARAPRELVEYVVVHEYTHFAVHNHGPDFQALMDRRLPGWQLLRKRLNKRDWEVPVRAEGAQRVESAPSPMPACEPPKAPRVAPVASFAPSPVPPASRAPEPPVPPRAQSLVQEALPGF